MNNRGSIRHSRYAILFACAILAVPLLLSACQAAVPPAQPTAAALPTQAPLESTQPPVEATQPPAEVTQAPVATTGELTLDLSGIAQGMTFETVEAVPESAGGPFWEVAPEYQRATMQGYPVTDHLLKPQISIYPVSDLATFNPAAGGITADLQALLASHQPGDHLPFLPLFNAAQVMHAQVQYLDFKNGSGVRFLTQFDQAILPINNYELIYTFQGLTNDGKYYIAAVLPVTHPDLPATNQVSQEQASQLSDFATYLSQTVAWLDQQPAGSFTPDLAALDALIQSIEIK